MLLHIFHDEFAVQTWRNAKNQPNRWCKGAHILLFCYYFRCFNENSVHIEVTFSFTFEELWQFPDKILHPTNRASSMWSRCCNFVLLQSFFLLAGLFFRALVLQENLHQLQRVGEWSCVFFFYGLLQRYDQFCLEQSPSRNASFPANNASISAHGSSRRIFTAVIGRISKLPKTRPVTSLGTRRIKEFP